LLTYPSESYLVFDGKLVKNAEDAYYADADVITLTKNAMMHLFSKIKYQLSGQEIESLFHPGQETMMLGLLKVLDDFQKSTGLNQLWMKDSHTTAHFQSNIGFAARQGYIIQKPEPKGTFSFKIPLKHIFGFCDDYEKVVYGFKHQLTLVRKGDNDVIFRGAAADAGKVVLAKLFWCMPHVSPNLQEKLALYKTIESKSSLPVGYRMIQYESTQSRKREIPPGDCR